MHLFFLVTLGVADKLFRDSLIVKVKSIIVINIMLALSLERKI